MRKTTCPFFLINFSTSELIFIPHDLTILVAIFIRVKINRARNLRLACKRENEWKKYVIKV